MTLQNWLITGVSSGFGRELATQLLARGDTVVGTVRRPDSAADLADKYRTRFAASWPAYESNYWLPRHNSACR